MTGTRRRGKEEAAGTECPRSPDLSGKPAGGRKKAREDRAAVVPGAGGGKAASEAAFSAPDQGRVVQELSAIAFATVADLCRWDEGGVSLLDSLHLSREQAAAVAEIAESSTGKGAVRIKLHSKLKALEMLGRHLGMFTQEGMKTGEGESPAPLSANLRERLDALFPVSGADPGDKDESEGEDQN